MRKFIVFVLIAAAVGLVLCRGRHGGEPPASGLLSGCASIDWTSTEVPLEALGRPEVPDTLRLLQLERLGYTMGYDPATRLPRWVMWRVTADRALAAEDSSIKKKRNYHEDIEVPEPRAAKDDYRGIYNQFGLTHGHMCPAADCKWDPVAMDESNLLTNICPQDRLTNTGIWNKMEQTTRQWAKKYGCVYVVSGPLLYKQEHHVVGEHCVVVPEAFYKVVLRLGDSPTCIAWMCKNGDGGSRSDYVNTLEQAERITGFRFFPGLPDSIRVRVASHAGEQEW